MGADHQPVRAKRIIGIVLIGIGGVWFLQGIGVIGGSFMTNSSTWVLIGAIAVIVGVSLLISSRPASR